MKVTLAVLICMLCVNFAFAQTVADLKAKYGKAAEVYTVSEHIWMTPLFTADGQTCQMRLFRRRMDGDTNYLEQKLPFVELTNALNALVPVDQRGGKKQPFGATATGGPTAWTTYSYEKVTFIFVSFFPSRGYDDSPPLRKGDFVFPIEGIRANEESENSPPTGDDFRDSQASGTDIVTIKWNGRKCGGGN